jgi:predicted dehydrogenase
VGRWGVNIAKKLRELAHLDLIVEESQPRRVELEREFSGVEIASRIDAAFDRSIDAVAIATPAVTHYDLAATALRAGKHVFVEKPMCMTSEEAEALVRLANECGRSLMVGHLLLYQPAITFVKRFIEAGHIGRPLSIKQIRKSLGTVRRAENVLFSLGVHDLAVLQYLVDEEPVDVSATGLCALNESIEDEVDVAFAYAGGLRATLSLSWLSPVTERGLVVIGEQGSVVYDELSQTVTHHASFIDASAAAVRVPETIVFEGARDPLRFEMEHFIESISLGRQPLSNGEHGATVVRLLNRIQNQLESRRSSVVHV